MGVRLTVIGIGQSLRGDDAAGLEAVRAWEADHPDTAASEEIRVETAELPGLGLLDMLENVEAAIIVDAVQGGCCPGTIQHVSLGDLDSFSEGTKSAHGWGPAETLRLGSQLDPDLKRTEIHVIGIEAEQFAIGGSLSAAVRQALPRASEAIQEQVERLIQDQAD